MKRLIAALAIFGATAQPAAAHSGPPGASEVTFEALPCAVACAYWLDNGFEACERPFPPGSYADHLTAPAPAPPEGKRVVVLEATIDPKVDWDLFLCESEPPHRGYPRGHILGEPCDNLLGSNNLVPVGCHEDYSAPLKVGQTVILRAYNWSDPLPTTGRYWFTFI